MSTSRFSYFQNMWVAAYRKVWQVIIWAQPTVYKGRDRSIQKKTSNTSKRFSLWADKRVFNQRTEQRSVVKCNSQSEDFSDEWNQVSKICGAKSIGNDKFDYTPLCKWGNQQAGQFRAWFWIRGSVHESCFKIDPIRQTQVSTFFKRKKWRSTRSVTLIPSNIDITYRLIIGKVLKSYLAQSSSQTEILKTKTK